MREAGGSGGAAGGAGAGQAGAELAQGQPGQRIAPVGDPRGGGQDKAAVAESGVGNGQRGLARRRGPHTARPQDDIEIEHPRAPALATRAATEMGFDRLESAQQGGRIEPGADNCGTVGKGPPALARADARR